MNITRRSFLFLYIVSLLIASCGGTQAPAAQSVQITDLVVILVVDTFSESDVIQSTDANCSVTPDALGQQFGGKVAATTYLGGPHGKYVYEDLMNLIRTSDEFNSSRPVSVNFAGINLDPNNYSFIKSLDLIVSSEKEERGLLVVTVDTNNLSVDSMINNIPLAIDLFSNNDVPLLDHLWPLPKTNQFVVNMSFVLVPCDPDPILKDDIKNLLKKNGLDVAFDNFDAMTVDDFSVYNLAKQYDSNEKFHEGIYGIKPLNDLGLRLEKLGFSSVEAAVFQAFIVYLIYDPDLNRDWQYSPNPDNTCRPDQDGFYNMLCNYFYNKGLEIINVGAAGNFEDRFPYAPASWDFVDSISSQASTQEQKPVELDNGLSLAEYSNWGEIQMDGVFIGDSNFASNILGTSFAAPKFSYEMASYLLSGGSSPCTDSPNIMPVLGYGEGNEKQSLDNMKFMDAMNRFCPSSVQSVVTSTEYVPPDFTQAPAAVSSEIDKKYISLGGEAGVLGSPLIEEQITADGNGRFRNFQGGAIYWIPNIGAYEVHGSIYAKWLEFGLETGLLGYPMTDETPAPDGIGRFNHFQYGSIYWTPDTGAWEVHGSIRDKWASLGWETGLLGYPLTDETVTPDGVGRFNHFQGGSIYWTPNTGAWEVHGVIRDKWASLGWETSCFGYPISDEEPASGDWTRQSRFERGIILFSPDKGAVGTCY